MSGRTRRRWTLIVGALAFALSGAKPRPKAPAATAVFEAPLAPPAALVAAWRAGDRDEALRAAERVGPERLAGMLNGADRASAAAALWIAPEVEAPWTLMAALAALAEGPDRRTAVAACTALRAAARASTGPAAGWAVEPEPSVRAAAERMAALAVDRGAWPDVRIAALASALALDAAARPTAPARVEVLALLLGDPDLEVRRAAAELSPVDLPALGAALADPEPAVARAAAATLASGAGAAGAESARLGTLIPAAIGWATDTGLPASERAAAVRILWAGGAEAERRLVEALSKDKTSPAALRETARSLLKRWKKGKPLPKPKPPKK